MQTPDLDAHIVISPKTNMDKFVKIYCIISLPFQPLAGDVLSFSSKYGAKKSVIPNTVKLIKVTLDGNVNSSTIIKGSKAWEDYLYNKNILVRTRKISSQGDFYLIGELAEDNGI